MADYSDYISIEDQTLYREDSPYGKFTEYEIYVNNEIKELAYEQYADEYIPSEDSYIDYYIHRYEDGSTRIWIGIHEDFTNSGTFVDGELVLTEDIQASIETAPIEF